LLAHVITQTTGTLKGHSTGLKSCGGMTAACTKTFYAVPQRIGIVTSSVMDSMSYDQVGSCQDAGLMSLKVCLGVYMDEASFQ
jgi:hypothetical protein